MPPLMKTVEGKKVVNALAATKEAIKDNKAVVARWALG